MNDINYQKRSCPYGVPIKICLLHFLSMCVTTQELLNRFFIKFGNFTKICPAVPVLIMWNSCNMNTYTHFCVPTLSQPCSARIMKLQLRSLQRCCQNSEKPKSVWSIRFFICLHFLTCYARSHSRVQRLISVMSVRTFVCIVSAWLSPGGFSFI